ncbi:hypothetical protein C8R46DRAFT_312119 [Mycena filopes]|nr:hypothetical protein C8R46DRAFT_312119 [Mycena filopes]
MDAILTACPRITDLFSHYAFADSLDALKSLHFLRRLVADVSVLFGPDIDFTLPFFHNITHLEVLDEPAAEDTAQYANLALMPALTHLALDYIDLCSALQPLFTTTLSHLRCIVFLSADSWPSEEDLVPVSVDDRFVHVVQQDFATDWMRGAKTGEDYWSLADAFVAARRAGKIRRTRFTIHDTDDIFFERD